MKLTRKLTKREPHSWDPWHDNGPRDHGLWERIAFSARTAKYLFPNRFIYGAVLSLWTQRLMNIHDIQSLDFYSLTLSLYPLIYSVNTPLALIATPWSWRIGKALLCGTKGLEFESAYIANNLLPYLWILDITCLGKKISPPGLHLHSNVVREWTTYDPPCVIIGQLFLLLGSWNLQLNSTFLK